MALSLTQGGRKENVFPLERVGMAGIRDLSNAWQTVTELDVRPMREQAESGVQLALVGKLGSGRHALAEQMRRDPSRPEKVSPAPISIFNLDESMEVPRADLIILLMNAADPDDRLERIMVRRWLDAGLRVFAFINRPSNLVAPESGGLAIDPWLAWGKRNVLVGPVDDSTFLTKEFVPAIMHLLPDLLLAMGRYYPLFRVPIARYLINDACFSNAAYSLGTGLAEIVPVFNIPLNLTDVLVLTKNQIFLAYKIGLALGLPTDLQSYFTTFGGVLGAGFFWRQTARSLVGLIPGWGVIPKVAVAYAGTVVVGNAVLQWYLTDRHITAAQIRQLYAQAFAKGKQLVPRLRRDRKRLASGEPKKERRQKTRKPQRVKGDHPPVSALPETVAATQSALVQICPSCGRANAADASYCQYCGKALLSAA